MASKKLVLVFGATGLQGGAVIKEALKSEEVGDYLILGVTRDPASAQATELAVSGVRPIVYDPKDHAAIFDQVKSVASGEKAVLHAVFSVQNAHQASEVEQGIAIADEAEKAGFRYLVYSSVDWAGKNPTGVSVYDSKIAIEDHIRSLKSISWTILRPSWFMNNWLNPAMRFAMFVEFSPESRYKLIAGEDLGKVAAIVLRSPAQYAGRMIELAGDDVTLREAKNKLEKHTGETHTMTGPEVLPPPALPLFKFNAENPHLADVQKTKEEFGFVMDFETFLSRSP